MKSRRTCCPLQLLWNPPSPHHDSHNLCPCSPAPCFGEDCDFARSVLISLVLVRSPIVYSMTGRYVISWCSGNSMPVAVGRGDQGSSSRGWAMRAAARSLIARVTLLANNCGREQTTIRAAEVVWSEQVSTRLLSALFVFLNFFQADRDQARIFSLVYSTRIFVLKLRIGWLWRVWRGWLIVEQSFEIVDCLQVFGLGNKTYEHYNEVALDVDHRLEQLGANRVFECGLGDDDAKWVVFFLLNRQSLCNDFDCKSKIELSRHCCTWRQLF